MALTGPCLLQMRNDRAINAPWRSLLSSAACHGLDEQNEDKYVECHVPYSQDWHRSASAISAPFVSKASCFRSEQRCFLKYPFFYKVWEKELLGVSGAGQGGGGAVQTILGWQDPSPVLELQLWAAVCCWLQLSGALLSRVAAANPALRSFGVVSLAALDGAQDHSHSQSLTAPSPSCWDEPEAQN